MNIGLISGSEHDISDNPFVATFLDMKVAILKVLPCFFEGFYLIFDGNSNVL
jgi:hypothetical protein